MAYKIAFSTMALESKIPQGDPVWTQFNGSFVNREMEPIDIANDIYMGHAFTAWHKNNWRETSNFLMSQYIALDFDSGDNRSSIDYLVKDDFIQKYASFLYTTPSHTSDAPKGRALFLIDQPIQQGNNYTRSVMAMLWLFGGLTTPDRKCKDPCRFFYGSKHCEIRIINIDNVLPLELVKYLIGQYEATGQQQKQVVATKEYKPSTANEQEIADALRVIPAWGIDYEEWYKVLMGIHNHLGDAGLGLAESWGQGEDGEISKLWRCFKPNGNGSGAVTIKTLFKLAYQHGWQGVKPV